MTQPPNRCPRPSPGATRTVVPLETLDSGRTPHRVIHSLTMLIAVTTGACAPGPQAPPAQLDALPRTTASVAGIVEAETVTISALTGGDPDGRRVIFVHGTPGSARGWGDYLIAPPEGHDYIAIDRPGFGESGPVGAVTRLQAQAKALEPFLVQREGAWPILVGHSLGGPVVVQAAADFPDKVGGLVIVAGALDPDLEDVHFMQPVGEWPVVRRLVPRPLRNSNRELMALEAELRLLEARLPAIAVPTVIVHGTADNLVPFENVAFMEARLTGVAGLKIMELEGRNHFLPWHSKSTIDAAIAAVQQMMDP